MTNRRLELILCIFNSMESAHSICICFRIERKWMNVARVIRGRIFSTPSNVFMACRCFTVSDCWIHRHMHRHLSFRLSRKTLLRIPSSSFLQHILVLVGGMLMHFQGMLGEIHTWFLSLSPSACVVREKSRGGLTIPFEKRNPVNFYLKPFRKLKKLSFV